MDKAIKRLRTFFRLSNAIFDAKANIVNAVLDRKPVPTQMEALHRLALEEIEKENPDMQLMDRLLAQMEEAAQPKPKFEKGGITAK